MFYSHSTIDRADLIRKDNDSLKAKRKGPHARLVPVWRNQSLVGSTNAEQPPEAFYLLPAYDLEGAQIVYLGEREGYDFFAIDVSPLNESSRDALLLEAVTIDGSSGNSLFSDLRIVGPTLNDEDGALLAYARALIYWNANTQYCLRCGHSHKSVHGGHARCCTNEDCQYLVFPRTDPAVIMLVRYQASGEEDRCLLGRSPNWPEGVYSTLAGFVEPGETLEAAVQREVFEEAGVYTTDVQYIASQPWPFPRSIMLGFEATATSTEVNIDPDEIENAQWFTREQIAAFGQWGDESTGYKLPRKDSIARFLIDRWLSEAH